MDLPTGLTKPDLTLLDANDTIPSNIDPSTISYLGEFSPAPLAFFLSNPNVTVKWWDNGVAHSFQTRTILDAIGDQGWVTVETVLIRLNTTYTPSGRFPVYSNESVPDANGVQTRIGYDAAVCVQKYEPWIIEAYNTTIGSPSALRIVDKVYDGTSSLPSGHIRGDPIVGTRNLNTTGKSPAFYVAHDNSINQMVKDNGRDFFYVPSPTVGPMVSSRLTNISSDLGLFHRPFRSPKAPDPRGTSNYRQIGSLLSAHESMRQTFCHTSRGRDPWSRNCTRIGRWHTSLTSSGS